MILLAINWGSTGLKIAQLLLSLSILVVLHEFGHYITAKWFKCRVEKFYLFFDPWFSLFKKKIGDTVYGIGWLPLGGYVKISGMVDESMDKEQMNRPPQPWEFRSKPAWQRLIIMLGGVTVNVLLAFIIYAGILMKWGEEKVPAASLKYGISFHDPIFRDLGFKSGDKILAVDGKPVDEYKNVLKKLLLVDHTVTVERAGQKQDIQMPVDLIGKLIEKKKSAAGPLLDPRVPVIVMSVPDSAAVYKAGLRPGDRIISINKDTTDFNDQYDDLMVKYKKGDSVFLNVKRKDSILALHTVISIDGKLGFLKPQPEQYDSLGIYKYTVKKYVFLEAFPAGVRRAGAELKFYIDQFKKILSPKTGAFKGVGGFKAMGSVFSGNGWDWQRFWEMTAMFSIILAFMNLLPIPALDGGHVLFTLIEMITGKKPNQKVLEYAQVAGMMILLALMLYANLNDWFGWGKGK